MWLLNIWPELRYILPTSAYSSRFLQLLSMSYFLLIESRISGKYFYFIEIISHLLLTTLACSRGLEFWADEPTNPGCLVRGGPPGRTTPPL